MRLRRSDCSSPGITRVRRGRGFSSRSPAGAPSPTSRPWSESATLAIPPAWKDVWICATARPPPGGRNRRGRAAPVPLPPALARAPRPREVRTHARFRPRAARAPPPRARATSARRPRAQARARVRGPAAGRRVLPRRTERRTPRRTRPTAWRPCASRTPRSAATRAVPLPAPSRASEQFHFVTDPAVTRSSRASSAPRRGESCSPTSEGRRWQDVRSTTSTTTSRSRPAKSSARRTSGPGTRRCWRRGFLGVEPPATASRPQDGGEAPGGHGREVGRRLLGNTPAVCRSVVHRPARVRPVPVRLDDRRRRREIMDEPFLGRPRLREQIEAAVMDLLEEPKQSRRWRRSPASPGGGRSPAASPPGPGLARPSSSRRR